MFGARRGVRQSSQFIDLSQEPPSRYEGDYIAIQLFLPSVDHKYNEHGIFLPPRLLIDNKELAEELEKKNPVSLMNLRNEYLRRPLEDRKAYTQCTKVELAARLAVRNLLASNRLSTNSLKDALIDA